MSTRILSIGLLLLSVCLCFQSSEGNRRLPGRFKLPHPCCVKLTNANISDKVTGNTYREQSAKSPCVKAIIFSTQQGQVCVDPKIEWVQEFIANMTKV